MKKELIILTGNRQGKDNAQMKKEKWFTLLVEGNKEVNLERVGSLAEINGLETLEYVLRTIEYLITCGKSSSLNMMVKRTLQWSEVAKCGNESKRSAWKEAGFNLSIHNLGSAEIYKLYSEDSDSMKNIVSDMIKIHGTIGQYLRGEISEKSFEPVYRFYEDLLLGAYGCSYHQQDIFHMFENLVGAVIFGVNEQLWNSVKDEVCDIIRRIPDKKVNFSVADRFRRIKPDFGSEVIEDADKYCFWFPHIALESFSDSVFLAIMKLAVKEADKYDNVDDINFKRISDFLYYDYKGNKHVNIYKKRIIESFIKTGSNRHVDIQFSIEDNVLFVNFKLSKTCEKLVEFCDEAELSGDISYEQAIVMLFDFFDFRHDTFDRLNNEESYLDTMNDISSSRKGDLINYVKGDTLVDVGSGSGILLNMLEERYPNKSVFGTDVSSTVIETLKKKKSKENRSWEVKEHNFVDSCFSPCSTVIFSSILHEIYSYTEGENGHFDIESVKKALKNAYESIVPGGRILIRDGVKTPSSDTCLLLIKTPEAKDFFDNYCRDFKGLKEYDRKNISVSETPEGALVSADINFIREFMYTLTWGPASYFNEVKEQFGYFTMDEFVSFFRELGANILVAESYFEKDYQVHLEPMVTLMNQNQEIIRYPDSNCFIIVEKPQ